jgi:uncharacterized membrane protein
LHLLSTVLWAEFVPWLHRQAAICWVGGQFYLIAVVLPMLRTTLAEAELVASNAYPS